MAHTEKCDACGKFRAFGDLAEEQHLSLDEYGGLYESWRLYCRWCEPSMFSEPVGATDSGEAS